MLLEAQSLWVIQYAFSMRVCVCGVGRETTAASGGAFWRVRASCFDSALLSSSLTQFSLKRVTVASAPQSCQVFVDLLHLIVNFFYHTVTVVPLLSCLFIPASCPRAIPRLLLSISKSLWPTCARLRSVCPLLSPSLLTCSSTNLTLMLAGRVWSCSLCFVFFCVITKAFVPGIWSQMFLCVCSLTQAGWEKRVLKSLNSMSTELDVPLARMVTKLPSLKHSTAFLSGRGAISA